VWLCCAGKGSGVDALLKLLWADFTEHPERGVTKEIVYQMVKSLGGQDVLNAFSTMVEGTEDIDFDSYLKKMGCEIRYQESNLPWIGADFEYVGDRAIVKSILTDSPAYRAGLNAGDEVLFLNGLRLLKDEASSLGSYLVLDKSYELIISRLGKLERVEITPAKAPRTVKEIAVIDRELAIKSFDFLK
jgi:predicted metalloprotease with PDZ domain